MPEGQPIPAQVDIPAPTLVDNLPDPGSTGRRRTRKFGPTAAATAAAIAAAALVPGTATASPESRAFAFTVSAIGPDTYTGLHVAPGQELTFDFDEREVNTNVFDQNSPWVGPEGNPTNAQGNTKCRRVPGPTGATILAIVGPNGRFEFTTPVKDGSKINVQKAGVVDLFINERPDTFREGRKLKNCLIDNGGSTGGILVQKFS